LSGSIYYAPGIQPSGTTNVAYAGLPFQRKVTELGLAYANGPLSASWVNLAVGQSDTAAAAGTVTPVAQAAITNSSTTNILTAKYELGAHTFYTGYNKGATLGVTETTTGPYYLPASVPGRDTNGTRLGYKYTVGEWDFIASANKQKIANQDPATTFNTRKVVGLRVVDNLSKTTAVYIGYEGYTTGADLAANNAAYASDGGKYTLVSIGVKKAF